MATYAALFGVEEAVSAGWKSLLSTQFAADAVTIQLVAPAVDGLSQTDELKVPRVEIEVQNEGNTEYTTSDSNRFFGEFVLGIVLRVVTDRVQANGTHADIRSTCRTIAHTSTQSDWDTELPNYEVNQVIERATEYSADSQNRLDITVLNFSMTIRVRQASWPA